VARFKDPNGKEWHLDLTTTALKRIKSYTGVNLLDVLQRDEDDVMLMAKLKEDPVLCGEVLFAFCEPQCEKAQITPEDFVDLFRGDLIETASDALLDSIEEYLPEKKGKRLRAIRDKIMAAAALTEEKGDAIVAAVDPQAIHEQVMSGLRGRSASQESSESTPAHSP
jgi:hypothetical protein